ncbi:MAG TPA: DUF2314 domain-containing protein [Desulfuromonadaceae bacterium]|nr:DUF2314 domain-containing protein [Desulfuromonadaceae bacterium]
MRLLITIIAAISLLMNSGCSRSKEGGNYTHVESDDAAMNAAIAKAKATSGDFIRAFHEQKPGTKGFFVKKPYPTPSGEMEHMWIEVSAESNGVLDGAVANEAEETRAVKIGQKVSLNISEISDWKYVDGKKLVGGYTIRYSYERMSPKEQEDFIREAGFEL